MFKKFVSLVMPVGYSKYLFWVLLAMGTFGAVMVTSASMNTFSSTQSIWSVFIKEVIILIISYVAMVRFAYLFSFRFMKKFEVPLIIGTFIVLLIPRFMPTVANAYNWIRIGSFSIQPSEFAKVVVMILIANSLGDLPEFSASQKKRLEKLKTWDAFKVVFHEYWFPLLAVITFIFIIIVIQSDLGSAVVMLFIALFMLLSANHPLLGKPQKVILGLVLVATVMVLWIMSPQGAAFLDSTSMADNYMVRRITSIYYLFRPENITNSSLQQVKGLFSFAYGGLGGVGLGNSIQKYGYLPAADTDYILAIVVEELGIWGFLLIAVGYIILISVLVAYAMRVSSNKGRLVLIGIATYLFIHFTFNVGGVTAILPLTGIPLLLISSGGSSKMALFIAMGIAQNIIARDNVQRKRATQEMVDGVS